MTQIDLLELDLEDFCLCFFLFLEKDRILPGTRSYRSPGGREAQFFWSNQNQDSGCRLAEVGRGALGMIVEAVLQIGELSDEVVVQNWMLGRDEHRQERLTVAHSGEGG